MSSALDEFTTEVHLTTADSVVATIEERIRLATQDKPRWLPQSLWNRILARVIRIEVG